jgi:HEAT repeat protein
MRAAICALVVVITTAVAADAQPPAVNARIVNRPLQPDLAGAVAAIVSAQTDPAWLGYSVPTITERANIGNDGWSERCRLEQSVRTPTGVQTAGPIRLEPSPTVMVLMRVANHAIEKIRSFSSDCQIDAGGLTLYWFDSVPEPGSVALLKTMVADSPTRERSDQALSAIGFHRDRSAATALLDLARNSPNTRTRQRAIVLIARRADRDAATVISQAIEQDADVEVKKQAVFALSQLPPNDGIPLLIQLARTTRNPVIKRQALVFLGQSKDPRALSYLEEILR